MRHTRGLDSSPPPGYTLDMESGGDALSVLVEGLSVQPAASSLEAFPGAADSSRVSSLSPAVAADPRPVPDRVTLWPVDDGRFGIDATFQGASGYRNAERHEQVMRAAGLQYALRQELDGAWTLRLGPFPAAQARSAIESFLDLQARSG